MSFTKYYKDEEDGQGFQERDVNPIEGQPGAGTLNRGVLRACPSGDNEMPAEVGIPVLDN